MTKSSFSAMRWALKSQGCFNDLRKPKTRRESCLHELAARNVKPQCEPFGYALNTKGECGYIEAYSATPTDESGKKQPVTDKICLCYHFSKKNCYSCGHYVYRLKDTTRCLADGSYQLLSAEHIFRDYQFSRDHEIALPPERLVVSNDA